MELLDLPKNVLDLIFEELASEKYPFNAELACRQLFKHLLEFQWQNAAIWVAGDRVQFQTVVADWNATPLKPLSWASWSRLNALTALLKFRMKFAAFGVLSIYIGGFPRGFLPISRLLKTVWVGDFAKRIYLYADERTPPSLIHHAIKWKSASSDIHLYIYSKSAAYIPLLTTSIDIRNYQLGNRFGRYLTALSIKIVDGMQLQLNQALIDCKQLSKLSVFYRMQHTARLVLTDSIESVSVQGWFQQLHISKQEGGLTGLLVSRKHNSNPVQVFVPSLQILALVDIVKFGNGWINGVVDTFSGMVETLYIGRKQPCKETKDPLELYDLEPIVFIEDDFGEREPPEKLSLSAAHDNIHVETRNSHSIRRVCLALPFREATTALKCSRALLRAEKSLQRVELFASHLNQGQIDSLAAYSVSEGRRLVFARESHRSAKYYQ